MRRTLINVSGDIVIVHIGALPDPEIANGGNRSLAGAIREGAPTKTALPAKLPIPLSALSLASLALRFFDLAG